MRFDHMDFVDIFMSVFIKHSATISTRLEVANNYWLSTHLTLADTVQVSKLVFFHGGS